MGFDPEWQQSPPTILAHQVTPLLIAMAVFRDQGAHAHMCVRLVGGSAGSQNQVLAGGACRMCVAVWLGFVVAIMAQADGVARKGSAAGERRTACIPV